MMTGRLYSQTPQSSKTETSLVQGDEAYEKLALTNKMYLSQGEQVLRKLRIMYSKLLLLQNEELSEVKDSILNVDKGVEGILNL